MRHRPRMQISAQRDRTPVVGLVIGEYRVRRDAGVRSRQIGHGHAGRTAEAIDHQHAMTVVTDRGGGTFEIADDAAIVVIDDADFTMAWRRVAEFWRDQATNQ